MADASNLNLFYDFTNSTVGWTPLYGNANFNYDTEDNGNRYLRLSYSGYANKDREYFDVNGIL